MYFSIRHVSSEMMKFNFYHQQQQNTHTMQMQIVRMRNVDIRSVFYII